jgi:hypothetical protein
MRFHEVIQGCDAAPSRRPSIHSKATCRPPPVNRYAAISPLSLPSQFTYLALCLCEVLCGVICEVLCEVLCLVECQAPLIAASLTLSRMSSKVLLEGP